MADVTDLIEDSPKSLSRRNVIAGTAWGVPVVLGVGLSPEVAASPVAPFISNVNLKGKRGTNKTKKIVTFTWRFQASVTISLVSVTTSSSATTGTFTTPSSPTLTSGVYEVTFTFENANASSITVPDFTLIVAFTYRGTKKEDFSVKTQDVADNATVDPFQVTHV